MRKEIDYVEFYAEKMKGDNSIFGQQKKLIEAQLIASIVLFRRMFGEGDDFKKNAREYLRSIGLIK
jgi:hypothetical protein